MKRIQATKRERALDLYAEGFGIGPIARELGISTPSVLRFVRRAGIARDRQAAGLLRRSQSRIAWGPLSPERAWLLGLIFGDGGITANGNTVTLTIGDADPDIVRKVGRILECEVSTNHRTNCVQMNIYSRRLNHCLRDDFSLDENKCLTMKWPQLRVDLVRHFVRGLIDSDGCWTHRMGRQNTQLIFNYTSIARDFVVSMERALCESIEVCPRPVREIQLHKPFRAGGSMPRPAYRLEYSHLDCIALGNWVYGGETQHMRSGRKFAIWKSHASAFIKPHWRLRHDRHRTRLRAARSSQREPTVS